MTVFTKHTAETAPEGAQPYLKEVAGHYGGRIPDIFAYAAASPAALNAMLHLGDAMGMTGFSKQEQQAVLLSASVENGCEFCIGAHAGLLRKAGMAAPKIAMLKRAQPTGDIRIDALVSFTRKMVVQRGRLGRDDMQAFLDAGFAEAQIFDVILGIAYKTMTNYINHVARAGLEGESAGAASTEKAA